MNRQVLLVDDNQEMLLSLRDGLSKSNNFSISVAENGRHAMEILKGAAISLVVTDLKMPQVDGFGLLTHIMEHYPDISVIMMTAYSTPKMMQMARHGGAVGYIEKPFKIDELAAKIRNTLEKTAEGGTLHSVSSGIFLQFIEMEERTCTIRLTDKDSGKQGVLFFRKGELIGARAGNLQGEVAAYEIFSWDKTSLSIQNDCLQKKRTIQNDLQAIFLDALLLKDEKDDEDRNSGKKQNPPAGRQPAAEAHPDPKPDPNPVAPTDESNPTRPAALLGSPDRVPPEVNAPPTLHEARSPKKTTTLREVPHQRPAILLPPQDRPQVAGRNAVAVGGQSLNNVKPGQPAPASAPSSAPSSAPAPALAPVTGPEHPPSLRDVGPVGSSSPDETAKMSSPAPDAHGAGEDPKQPSETGHSENPEPEPDSRQRSGTAATTRIQRKLEQEIGERCGLERVLEDDAWDDLIAQFEKIGAVFNAGRLKVGHVDNGKRLDSVLVPGIETLVLSVSRKGPRDRILQVLGDV